MMIGSVDGVSFKIDCFSNPYFEIISAKDRLIDVYALDNGYVEVYRYEICFNGLKQESFSWQLPNLNEKNNFPIKSIFSVLSTSNKSITCTCMVNKKVLLFCYYLVNF